MVTATDLIDRARRRSGLEDFGDESFREGLERLLHALENEAKLNSTGEAALYSIVEAQLVNRLRVHHWLAREPEIDDEVIVKPLVGVGLPRTGSTALGCLLGEDPHVRSLRNTDQVAPCPPPGSDEADEAARRAMSQASIDNRNRLFPRMRSMLPSTATSPAECQLIMAQDFKSQIFQAFVRIPSYVEWLNYEAELVPTYRYLRQVLKLLQWRLPQRPWRLKNPSHILFIDALSEVFPDARFVMTHRDVAEVVPSVSDLYWEMNRVYSDDVDLHSIGRETADWCELGMRRMIAFREAGRDDRFFDIHFKLFQADPFLVLRQLFDWLGEPLTDEAITGMRAWRKAKPRDAAYERTDMAQFGLDAANLRTRFGFYSKRFAVSA